MICVIAESSADVETEHYPRRRKPVHKTRLESHAFESRGAAAIAELTTSVKPQREKIRLNNKRQHVDCISFVQRCSYSLNESATLRNSQERSLS